MPSKSHMRRRWQTMCRGKFQWEDPYDALREMFRLPYYTDVDEFNLSLYRCGFCDYWHLGTMNRVWQSYMPTPVTEQIDGQLMLEIPELEKIDPLGYKLPYSDKLKEVLAS